MNDHPRLRSRYVEIMVIFSLVTCQILTRSVVSAYQSPSVILKMSISTRHSETLVIFLPFLHKVACLRIVHTLPQYDKHILNFPQILHSRKCIDLP